MLSSLPQNFLAGEQVARSVNIPSCYSPLLSAASLRPYNTTCMQPEGNDLHSFHVFSFSSRLGMEIWFLSIYNLRLNSILISPEAECEVNFNLWSLRRKMKSYFDTGWSEKKKNAVDSQVYKIVWHIEHYQTVVGHCTLWTLCKCWRNNRNISVTEDIGTSVFYER
jgi:hypothetical protein